MTGPAQDGGKGPFESFTDKVIQDAVTHYNLRQDFVVITEDKIRLELIGNLKSQSDWLGPAGIAVTLITVLLTTDFKDIWFIGKDGARLLAVAVTTLLIYKTVQDFRATRKAPTLDSIVTKLKAASKSPAPK